MTRPRRNRGATVTRHERDSDTTPPPPPSPFSLEKNVARFLLNDGKRPQFFTGHHFKHFKINKTRATLEIFMQLKIPLAELPLEAILPPQDVAAGDVLADTLDGRNGQRPALRRVPVGDAAFRRNGLGTELRTAREQLRRRVWRHVGETACDEALRVPPACDEALHLFIFFLSSMKNNRLKIVFWVVAYRFSGVCIS